jgi:hypothetical protein
MVSIRRLLLAGTATLLVASACTTISSSATNAPINIPTVPPINIPSGITIPTLPPINIPTLPPINIPSGITIPTLPPINIPSGFTIPTIPPIELPSADANSGVCLLVTPAEMSQIVGAQVTVTSNDENSCTYTLPSFATVVLTETQDTDLSGVQFLMGSSAQQQTIGGNPGISGVVLGQPAAYVQKGGTQLQVLGVLLGSDGDQVAQMVQVANTAVARPP